MKVRRTRITRVLIAWIILFVLTVVLVAQPTGYSWGYWVYGLIWGLATALTQFLFPKLFEEEIER
ncbi:MAG: hypothetical protein ABFD97_08880 [Syntrophobacter sp.]